MTTAKTVRDNRVLVRHATDTAWDRDHNEYAPLPCGDHYSIDVIEPLVITEGREDCGSGPMLVSGGLVVAGHGYSVHRYRAKGRGEWRNYGAPHGTHASVEIEWVEVE